MVTISLCMIVKNEETVIARCLDSILGIADEIIIVDTGSTDKTKEIVSQYTDKIYDFEWIDNFSAARNFAFSKANMQYCMWLDADDIVLESDKQSLIEFKKTLSLDTDVVMMKYNSAFDETGKPTFTYYRERILRNCPNALWKGRVHEAIERWGKIIYSDIAISHKKNSVGDMARNLRIYRRQISEGEELTPRDQFYYARELFYHKYFQEAIDVFSKFLDDEKGWLENNIEACRFLSFSYYNLEKDREALEALLKSLRFDTPRAEICCDIGKHFFDRKFYQQAIFWYELALTRTRNDISGAFISADCYDFIPNIQLCVCYDKIGNILKAIEHNEKAGFYKPSSPAYLYNQEYYNRLMEDKIKTPFRK